MFTNLSLKPTHLAPVLNFVAANQNIRSMSLHDPLAQYQGVLPNGEIFTWGLLGLDAIPAILDLQSRVAAAATGLEKTFLIERSADNFAQSMYDGHLYWGAFVGDKLVGLFGMADNDEEVGDGRGKKTPKDALGVTAYSQVSILKGAQIDAAYRNQGLGALGALSRYQHFINTSFKQVMMTKIHSGNRLVCDNYTKNGFIKAYSAPVTDRGETFDVLTFKAGRGLIEAWLTEKSFATMQRFKFL